MPDVLIASDSQPVRDEVRAALPPGVGSVREVSSGAAVRGAVVNKAPDLVVVDLQMGSMGGMAVCMDLRLEESGGRAPHVPVLMLLDRRADVFLARRAGAEGWVVKPLDALRLNRAVVRLLAGQTSFDETYLPPTVALTHPATGGPLSDGASTVVG